MATCLQIITYAMRMNRILGIGKDPKGAEATEGMVALQSLYDQWRTGGMFGELEDVYLDEDDTAEEGKRYLLADGVTLTEPTYVEDEDRQIRDLALYEKVEDGVLSARLYDRTEFVDLVGLVSDDAAPLADRNAYGLAACLATSGGFIGAFGAEPSPATIALSRHFLRNVMTKATTQDKSTAEYF